MAVAPDLLECPVYDEQDFRRDHRDLVDDDRTDLGVHAAQRGHALLVMLSVAVFGGRPDAEAAVDGVAADHVCDQAGESHDQHQRLLDLSLWLF